MGLHIETWAIFVLFLAANQFLHLWGGKHTDHSTAVPFTFTNAGVAQTQNRGQLKTAPN